MKISEVIAKLEELKAKHGDIRVTYLNYDFEVSDVAPEVTWAKVNNKRETRCEYWKDLYKPHEDCYREPGEKLVKM